MLSQSPAFLYLCSCYIHADGDDMATVVLFRSQSGDLLPAQHLVSSYWPTSAMIKPSLCSDEMWKIHLQPTQMYIE